MLYSPPKSGCFCFINCISTSVILVLSQTKISPNSISIQTIRNHGSLYKSLWSGLLRMTNVCICYEPDFLQWHCNSPVFGKYKVKISLEKTFVTGLSSYPSMVTYKCWDWMTEYPIQILPESSFIIISINHSVIRLAFFMCDKIELPNF
jgi:hypothetical protein